MTLALAVGAVVIAAIVLIFAKFCRDMHKDMEGY